MNKHLKEYWHKIPDINRLRNAVGWGGDFAVYAILLAWFFLATTLPYLVPNTDYELSLAAIFVSRILIIAFVIFAMRSTRSRILQKFFAVVVCLTIGALLNVFFPVYTPVSNGHHNPSVNTTYVAFAPSCPYCRKAYPNAQRAAKVYNLTHSHQLKFVNLDKQDKLAKAMNKLVIHKGEVLRIDNQGNITHQLYTIGNKQGPLAPSAGYVYSIFENIK